MKYTRQQRAHTVPSRGFCMNDVSLVDFAIFDPNAVLFQLPFISSDLKFTTLIAPLSKFSLCFTLMSSFYFKHSFKH